MKLQNVKVLRAPNGNKISSLILAKIECGFTKENKSTLFWID